MSLIDNFRQFDGFIRFFCEHFAAKIIVDRNKILIVYFSNKYIYEQKQLWFDKNIVYRFKSILYPFFKFYSNSNPGHSLMSNLNGFLTRLAPKLASTEQFNKHAVGIRQSIDGLIGIGLPKNWF
jgi:hypothetical protein